MLASGVRAIANFFCLAEWGPRKEPFTPQPLIRVWRTVRILAQRFLDFARNDKRELAACARNLATGGRRSYI